MYTFYSVLTKLGAQYRRMYYGKSRVDYAPFNQQEWSPWKGHHHYIYSQFSGDSNYPLCNHRGFWLQHHNPQIKPKLKHT